MQNNENKSSRQKTMAGKLKLFNTITSISVFLG